MAAAMSRRHVLAGMCGCIGCCIGPAYGRSLNLNIPSLVGVDYAPTDPDEKGLWQSSDQVEESVANSSLLMQAAPLVDITRSSLDRMLGQVARDIRIYVVRDTNFNASMFPNGMMIVNSGLVARVRSEDQLAAILGHEAGHYLRKHSIHRWRSTRRTAGAIAFIGAGANLAAGVAAYAGSSPQGWIDIAYAINSSLVLSVFQFNREQESEADAYGLSLVGRAGYDTTAAAAIWRQLIEERKASAVMRKKKYRDSSASAFSTHPPDAERMRNLEESAAAASLLRPTGDVAGSREQRWNDLLSPFRGELLAEQVSLNDPGASLYLLGSLAAAGWTGLLKYYAGEVYRLRNEAGDSTKAAAAYAESIQFADAPAEAWRSYGYSLIKEGRKSDGQAALRRYLELAPNAKDVAIVRHSVEQ